MDIRIVIFLAFVSASVATNAILLWFAYRGFTRFTLKITESAHRLETSGTTKEWLKSLRRASEEAVSITETAKQRIAACEPELAEAQSRYGFVLARIDTRLEKLEETVSARLYKLREEIEGPAGKIEAFAAGMKGVAAKLGAADID